MIRKIQILDSSLRDGAQSEGISFSLTDKLNIVRALDELGIDLIEAGNPGSNPKDSEFFSEVKKLNLKHSQIVAFGSTRRKNLTCDEDNNIQSLLDAGTEYVCIVGKSWDSQVHDILDTSLENNLEMIHDTISYLVKRKKKVIFDAEHFFTGFKKNHDYALQTLTTAAKAGAKCICLCETKGNIMPFDCFNIVKSVLEYFCSFRLEKSRKKTLNFFPDIGVHIHNDSGLAIANSILAVQTGATHVQGTLLGIGERCGNANLSTLIANLQLKLNYSCIPAKNMKLLTPICKKVAEIMDISLDANTPYIGEKAFAHKAGMHIDAILKNAESYEHIDPQTVGNKRSLLVSEVAGRTLIAEKIHKFNKSIKKSDNLVAEVVNKIKDLEFQGYQFDGADASFEILLQKAIGKYKPFFNLHYYKINENFLSTEQKHQISCELELDVNGEIIATKANGDGPVNAMDIALRKALSKFYPEVSSIYLRDYKVRVLDWQSATAGKVRVLVESCDKENTWTTVGVSSDIIKASYLALVDSFEYHLMKFHSSK